jgi:uncharacterized protein (TIRG00374 family)
MNRKNIISAILFTLMFVITAYIILSDNNITEIWRSMTNLAPIWLFGALFMALFYVSAEGIMIWYLLRALNNTISLWHCVRYSFIGFFFSGITPSATGGQPAQLYYMKKSGLRMSDSTVVLMTVALIYKFILVILGFGILLFFWQPLHKYLSHYIYLYYIGLFLNILLVAILVFVMVSPHFFGRIVTGGEKILIRLHLLKSSEKRSQKINQMVSGYHQAVIFFLQHKKHILYITLFTLLQRCSLFFLTCLIYNGMGLTQHSLATVMLLQASVYIAVDMLPLPGAQGISELMYKTVFISIFPGTFLTASLCITRGISFYFLLIVSGLITAIHHRMTAYTI